MSLDPKDWVVSMADDVGPMTVVSLRHGFWLTRRTLDARPWIILNKRNRMMRKAARSTTDTADIRYFATWQAAARAADELAQHGHQRRRPK